MNPYPIEYLISPEDCDILIEHYKSQKNSLKMKLIGLNLKFEAQTKKAKYEMPEIEILHKSIIQIKESPDANSEFSSKCIQRLEQKIQKIVSQSSGIPIWEKAIEIRDLGLTIKEFTEIIQQLELRKKVLLAQLKDSSKQGK